MYLSLDPHETREGNNVSYAAAAAAAAAAAPVLGIVPALVY